MAQVQEEEVPSDDPVIEQRLANLSKELRCLQCQNQTLADSPAGLAADLRREIRVQMKAGKSDQEDHRLSHAAIRRLHPVSTARHVHNLSALVWTFCLIARRLVRALPLHQATTRFDS